LREYADAHADAYADADADAEADDDAYADAYADAEVDAYAESPLQDPLLVPKLGVGNAWAASWGMRLWGETTRMIHNPKLGTCQSTPPLHCQRPPYIFE
jgi:hypothetical protein